MFDRHLSLRKQLQEIKQKWRKQTKYFSLLIHVASHYIEYIIKSLKVFISENSFSVCVAATQKNWKCLGSMCYHMPTNQMASWSEANTICSSSQFNASLAHVSSAEENDFIQNIKGDKREAWIGITDSQEAGMEKRRTIGSPNPTSQQKLCDIPVPFQLRLLDWKIPVRKRSYFIRL